MFKKILFLVFIFSLSLNACKTSQSENNESNTQKIKDSTEVNKKSATTKFVFSTQSYTIPEVVNYFPMEGPYLVSQFRPIGWSADGIYAYVIEPADEACDCYFFKLYIQNLKTDQIEWKFDFQKEIGDSSITIDSVWKANDSLFSTQLNKFKIVQSQNIQLNKTDIKYKGKTYYYNFKKETKFDDQYQIDWVKASTLNLTEQNQPDKILFYYKETAYDFVLNSGLAGYMASPYEKRIAFVLWQARWGYEGTPYVVNFKIVGAFLP